MKGKKRNNAVGLKGRSGRKPFSQELIERARLLNYEELSKDILTKHLLAIKDSNVEDFKNTKDLVLPIVIKSMAEKKDVNFKNLTDDELNKKISEELEEIIT